MNRNKMIRKNIALGILLIFISGCGKVNNDCNVFEYGNAPTSSWFSSHGGSGEESHGHYILTCLDGGFLQIGETGFIPNSAKILVVKTDSEGKLLWKQEFSEGGHNLGNSAIETTDGFLICGALNENSSIIKLDKQDGTTIYSKSYDNGGSDAFEHMAVTSNGIVAVGYINAQDPTNTFYTEGQGYMMFLDSLGNKISGININSYLSHAYRVSIYNDELIISGLSQGANDYIAIKTDITGSVVWHKIYGGSKSDHCFGMDIGNDGSIFLTGHTLSGTENWDTYTMKIANDGNQIWEAKNGNPRGFKPKYIHDETWGIKSTDDGGCIIVAGTGDEYKRYKRRCGNDGDNSNTWHVYLLKYSSSGDLEWQKTFGGDDGSDWAGEDIDLTDDGAAIIAVDNGEFGFLKTTPF